MAIYVIEGMDNCGKTSVINHLIKNDPEPRRLVLHSSTPPKGVDALEWSMEHYQNIMDVALSLSDDGWSIYMDRAHLGECVYGPIYRNTNGDWVFDLEEDLCYSGDDEEIYLIVLVGTDKHCKEYDDGLNISSDKFSIERDLFKKAFNNSTIKKKILIEMDRDFSNLFETIDTFIKGE
jgi:thymidylate kinase